MIQKLELSTIKEEIEGSLSTLELRALHGQLGISQTKLTRILNNPEAEATAEHIERLSPILGISKVDLVFKYRMGYNVVNLPTLDAWRLEAAENEAA